MSKLHINAAAKAASLCCGLLYLVCAFLVAIAPIFTIRLFNYFLHGIDLTKIAATNLSWGNFFFGLIFTLVFVYLITALLVWLYNKFAPGQE